ncbi:LacI family DNA-binding transcriptional regulator [Marinilabiliaceae bacterium ANBcel2]|nr:LacI family DNA-binding transcriptional regulator [Marinilabiliaceae bacterium ANBcel2]
MKQSHITIKDIARILNVSPSTVSRALKDHPDISEETRNLVKTFAEKVKYRPNALALSLRKQKTNTIGLVIPEIVHHFFSSVISGMEDLAHGKGYNIIICQSNENYYREVINLQTLLDHRVDGIMVSLSKTTRNFDHIQNVLNNNTPLIFFDRICSEIETDKVITDDFEGAKTATKYLLSKGADKILHLAGPRHLDIGINRVNGYKEALKEYNIEPKEEFILKCDTREEVFTLKQHFLEIAPKINGIFAVNDSTAIAAMQILQKNNYKIPEDIQIMGFGDGPVATIASPALSTIEQKGYEMGCETVQLLIHRLENPEAHINHQVKIITPKLKKRDSTL